MTGVGLQITPVPVITGEDALVPENGIFTILSRVPIEARDPGT